jgi:hypothetical protein
MRDDRSGTGIFKKRCPQKQLSAILGAKKIDQARGFSDPAEASLSKISFWTRLLAVKR